MGGHRRRGLPQRRTFAHRQQREHGRADADFQPVLAFGRSWQDEIRSEAADLRVVRLRFGVAGGGCNCRHMSNARVSVGSCGGLGSGEGSRRRAGDDPRRERVPAHTRNRLQRTELRRPRRCVSAAVGKIHAIDAATKARHSSIVSVSARLSGLIPTFARISSVSTRLIPRFVYKLLRICFLGCENPAFTH